MKQLLYLGVAGGMAFFPIDAAATICIDDLGLSVRLEEQRKKLAQESELEDLLEASVECMRVQIRHRSLTCYTQGDCVRWEADPEPEGHYKMPGRVPSECIKYGPDTLVHRYMLSAAKRVQRSGKKLYVIFSDEEKIKYTFPTGKKARKVQKKLRRMIRNDEKAREERK